MYIFTTYHFSNKQTILFELDLSIYLEKIIFIFVEQAYSKQKIKLSLNKVFIKKQ